MDIQIAKDATTEDQAKLLMTMPGVDYYAAMVLLSEIGDVHRLQLRRETRQLGRPSASSTSIRRNQLDRTHHQERQQTSSMDSRPMRPIRKTTRPTNATILRKNRTETWTTRKLSSP